MYVVAEVASSARYISHSGFQRCGRRRARSVPARTATATRGVSNGTRIQSAARNAGRPCMPRGLILPTTGVRGSSAVRGSRAAAVCRMCTVCEVLCLRLAVAPTLETHHLDSEQKKYIKNRQTVSKITCDLARKKEASEPSEIYSSRRRHAQAEVPTSRAEASALLGRASNCLSMRSHEEDRS